MTASRSSVAIVTAIAIVIACTACSDDDGRLKAWTMAKAEPFGPRAGSVDPPAVTPSRLVPPTPPFDVPPPQDKIVSFARAERHACVVRASGGVDCWGQPLECTGHNCTMLPADATIRRVPGVTDAKLLSRNARCVIRRNGELACLADDTLEFEPVAGVKDVRAIDDTGDCVVIGAGTVACREGSGPLFPAEGITDAVSLASGDFITCAIRKTGQVACMEVNATRFMPVRGLTGVRELVIAGDIETRACAASLRPGTRDGKRSVWCFALESLDGDVLVATEHSSGVDWSLRDPAAFANATQLSLAQRRDEGETLLEGIVDGKVVQINLRFDNPSQLIPELRDAVQHVAGCALRATGALACWGRNEGGVLSQPTTIGNADNPPTTVVGLADAIDIGLGYSHSWALTRDGKLYRWGGFRSEPLAAATPVPLGVGPANLVELVAIAEAVPCMRSATGSVWCYLERIGVEQLDVERVVKLVPGGDGILTIRGDGRVDSHVLYDLASIESLEPMEIPAYAGARNVAGQEPTCLLQRDNSIRCGGDAIPVTNAKQIVRGSYFGCALHDEVVSCWTYHYDKNGKPSMQGFHRIENLEGVTDLAASREYACAVYDGGRVGCVDFGERGEVSEVRRVISSGAVEVELGHGTTDQMLRSRDLHGPQPAGAYGCAIMVDRSVQCWGSNHFGELGDGSLVATERPIGVKL